MAPAEPGPACPHAPLLFSLDLEDHTERYPARGGRYQEITLELLDVLDALGIRGTAFVVGRVALTAPWLVREVAGRGHEIACHSLAHRTLVHETPADFMGGTREAKAALEDAAGTSVTGYRAPVFSLTPRSAWVVPALAELGFAYSSSVMPAAHPLYGFPGAPAAPFRWEDGPLEFPCPVARIGPLTLPYLGGIYLRYLPLALIRRLLRHASPPAWTYLHPYDFDAGEGYVRFPERSALSSLLLSLRRGRTSERLAELFRGAGGRVGPPLAGNGAGQRLSTFGAWARHEPFVRSLRIFAASRGVGVGGV